MTAEKSYLPGLMGARFMAALWVLAFHLEPVLSAIHLPAVLMPFLRMGYQGVDFFFVLSGFIIAYHYAGLLTPDRPGMRQYGVFLLKRLGRMYPLHLAMLLAVLCMIKAAPLLGVTINRPADYEAADFLRHLFLVNAWEFPARLSWNHFAWAVSAEWLVCVLAPLFLWGLARLRGLWAQMLVLVGFLAIAPLASLLLGTDALSPAAYALFRVIGGFGAGVVAWRYYRAGHPSIPADEALVLLLAGIWMQGYLQPAIDFLTVPFSVALIVALAQEKEETRSLTARLMRRPVMQYGGRISYALYITQFPVLMLAKKLFPFEDLTQAAAIVSVLYIAGLLSVLAVIAVTACHAIEEPCRRMLRNGVLKKAFGTGKENTGK